MAGDRDTALHILDVTGGQMQVLIGGADITLTATEPRYEGDDNLVCSADIGLTPNEARALAALLIAAADRQDRRDAQPPSSMPRPVRRAAA